MIRMDFLDEALEQVLMTPPPPHHPRVYYVLVGEPQIDEVIRSIALDHHLLDLSRRANEPIH